MRSATLMVGPPDDPVNHIPDDLRRHIPDDLRPAGNGGRIHLHVTRNVTSSAAGCRAKPTGGLLRSPAYGGDMARTRLRRLGRLLVIGLTLAALARAFGRARSRSVGPGWAGATSGDTWPPVPVNADRRPDQGAWETAAAP